MHRIGMLEEPVAPAAPRSATVSSSSYWLRAPEGGIFRSEHRIGHWVAGAERIGVISDPLGRLETPVVAGQGGIIIGQSHLPVVNRGDALFHIARAEQPQDKPSDGDGEPIALFDEDEII
jgi:predicted deacylase